MRSGSKGSMSSFRSRGSIRVRRLSWLRKWSQFLGLLNRKRNCPNRTRSKVTQRKTRRLMTSLMRLIEWNLLVFWRRKSSFILPMSKSDLSWKTRSRLSLLRGSFLELRLCRRLPIISKWLRLWVFSITLLILKVFCRFTRKSLILLALYRKRELSLLCREPLGIRLRIIWRRFSSWAKMSWFFRTRFLRRITKIKNIKRFLIYAFFRAFSNFLFSSIIRSVLVLFWGFLISFSYSLSLSIFLLFLRISSK